MPIVVQTMWTTRVVQFFSRAGGGGRPRRARGGDVLNGEATANEGSELIDTVLEFTHFLTVKVHLTPVNKV